MSYFRGDPYIWTDGEDNVHIWTDLHPITHEWRVKQMIVKEVFDHVAVVRVAEMVEDSGSRFETAADRAADSGNAGRLHKHTLAEMRHRLKSLLGVRKPAE